MGRRLTAGRSAACTADTQEGSEQDGGGGDAGGHTGYLTALLTDQGLVEDAVRQGPEAVVVRRLGHDHLIHDDVG